MIQLVILQKLLLRCSDLKSLTITPDKDFSKDEIIRLSSSPL